MDRDAATTCAPAAAKRRQAARPIPRPPPVTKTTGIAIAALTVAETGHLVLTTGHATSAAQAVERMIDLFPSHERSLAQSRLASFLVSILCQTLIPKADGSGRVAAVEVLLACPAVRNTIREGRTYQLPNAMMTQARLGMVLLDHILAKLYNNGTINYESMFSVCNDPEEIAKLIAIPT